MNLQSVIQCVMIVSNNCNMIFMSGELIVSRYVVGSNTNDAGCFGHIGLCQLCTKHQKCCASVVIDSATYVSAHNQFAWYRQCSSDPL